MYINYLFRNKAKNASRCQDSIDQTLKKTTVEVDVTSDSSRLPIHDNNESVIENQQAVDFDNDFLEIEVSYFKIIVYLIQYQSINQS